MKPVSSRSLGSVVGGRLPLVGLVATVVLLGLVSGAHGASIYWYGEGNSTCWQTGQPGSPAQSCDVVGEHFLNSSNPPRMITGAGSGDVELTSGSGDYCNAYNIGDALIYTDENSEESWTGFGPPLPRGSWQEGDAHESVCQADGSVWGQEIRGAVNSKCEGVYAPCGMQHYVSLQSQGDRPWSGALGSPQLVISSEADPQTAEVGVGAWGYVCPLLQQAATNRVIEFCLETWRIGKDFPATETDFDVSSDCASTHNYVFDQVITDFASNTKFATEMSGSANTFVFEKKPASRTFIAAVTESNLVNAIRAINANCHAGFSELPSEYTLLGVEDGLEGGGLNELGGHTANLQLRTEYTPLPPAEELSSRWSARDTNTGNQFVFYKGTNGLLNDTYYVAQTNGWASVVLGGEMAAGATPAVLRDQQTGNMWVFYRGVNNLLDETYYVAQSNGWASATLGGEMAAQASPSVVRDPSTGNMYVFYRGANGLLDETYYVAQSGGWATTVLGGQMAEGSNPSAVRDESTGNIYVFYKGTNGVLDEVYYVAQANGWASAVLGGEMAASATPSVIRNPATGNIYVFYKGKNGLLDEVYYVAQTNGWASTVLGGEMAESANPSAVWDPGTGNMYVFYKGKNGLLDETYYVAQTNGWASAVPGGEMASSAILSAVRDVATGSMFVFYKGKNGLLDDTYYSAPVGWATVVLGGEMA